jgi:hypothetical protein
MSNSLMMSILHIDSIALSQILFGRHVVPSAFLSTLVPFLGNVSGRHLPDHVPAVQSSGQPRILWKAPNLSHDAYILPSPLIPGFGSSYLAKKSKTLFMKYLTTN